MANALGYTWLVLLVATLFFVLLVLSYMEGASLHQERGGATVLARYGFNELWSFVAGWAILLDYLILIAITAFGTTDYAALFWGELAHGAPQLILASAVIVYVAWVNIRGAGSRRWERAAFVVFADLAVQLLIVILGLALVFEPDVLTNPAQLAGTPDAEHVLFAFTIAIAAFSGLDASSALAGEVAVSRRGLRRLFAARVPAAVVPYVGIGARRLLDAAADRGTPGTRRRCSAWPRRSTRRGCASRCATGSRCSPSPCWSSPATRPCSGSRGSATRSRSTARSRRCSGGCTRATARPWC